MTASKITDDATARSSIDLVAATAFGLEAVTVRELQPLGYEGKGCQPGRVAFRGDRNAICRTNLWLRSADRILVRLGEFPAEDFGQLFDGTKDLPWEHWLPSDARFPVNGRSIRSRLSSVPACQRIVKKAIADRLLAAHRTARLPETGAVYSIDLVLRNDIASLCIDTTGRSLHKRGYRKSVGQAPLKETMAASLVLLSFWRPGRRLLDPFCGTGTIAIEAALIGRNLAPGLGRDFACEHWHTMPESLWKAARAEAKDLALPEFEPRIIGTDLDPTALRLARFHARQAGVEASVHFQQRSFEELQSRERHGILITNPPYGERLGDQQQTRQLYAAMPSVFERLDSWSLYILTSHTDLERVLGRRADRRRKLYNGRIECTYYQFYGPKPPAA
jgi:23S rRNA G2445 N2-methylase RlmL